MRSATVLLLCVMARGPDTGVQGISSSPCFSQRTVDGILSGASQGEPRKQVAQDIPGLLEGRPAADA
jgi:hypothetical protein